MAEAKTSMAEAFAKAGIEPPEQKLQGMMREAMLKGVGKLPNVLAIFERMLLTANSASLERALVGDAERHYAASKLFNEIRDELRREQASGRGRIVCADRTVGPDHFAAPATPTPQEEAACAAPGSSGRMALASPAAIELLGQGHTPPADQVGQIRLAPARQPYRPSGALRVIANSYLAEEIAGRPVGEWRAGELLAWCEKTGRKVRFAKLLCHGLQDDMIIGEKKTDEDADRAWALAEAQDAA